MPSDPNPTAWTARQASRHKMADTAAKAVAVSAAWVVIDNPLVSRHGYTDGEFPFTGCMRTLQVNTLRRGKSAGGSGVAPSVALYTGVNLRLWDVTFDQAGKLSELVVRASVDAGGTQYDLLAPFNGMRQVMRPIRLSGNLNIEPSGGSTGLRIERERDTGDILLIDGRYTVNSLDGPLRLPRIKLRLSPKAATRVFAGEIPFSDLVGPDAGGLRWSYNQRHLSPFFSAKDEVHAHEGVTDDDGLPTLYQASPYGMPDTDLSLRYIGRAAGVTTGKLSRGHLMADRVSDDPSELQPMVVVTSPVECVALQLGDWDDREKCGYLRIPVV